MADWATLASLATAGGTLVLAVATFSSTRSSNRSARISERALQVGMRPVLMPARASDPMEKVGYADGHWLPLRDGLAMVEESDGNLYLAIPLRNVAQGIGVLHGWTLAVGRQMSSVPHAETDEFRMLQRDLYVPAGDTSYWQAALRDPNDPLYGPVRAAIEAREYLTVDLLYGDHEGGQRTITRFSLAPRAVHDGTDQDPRQWVATVSRHWNLDRDDPR